MRRKWGRLMSEQITIGICDDDKMALISIKGALQSYFEIYNIEVKIEGFQKVAILSERLKNKRYDLLFLDTDIGGNDGIDFARELRDEYSDIQLVFVSSHEERVYESLEVAPLAFIRKDKFLLDITEFMKRFDKLYDKLLKKDTILMVQIQNQGLYKVALGKILYFEGWKHYQLMYEEGEAEPKGIVSKLKDLEKELKPKGFVRIQRGYLVNMKYVNRLEKSELVLEGDLRLPVSRNNLQYVKKMMIDYNMNNDVMIL